MIDCVERLALVPRLEQDEHDAAVRPITGEAESADVEDVGTRRADRRMMFSALMRGFALARERCSFGRLHEDDEEPLILFGV